MILVAVALTTLAITLSHNAACVPPPALADNTELMKGIVYRCYGSPDVLEFEDIEKPTPTDNEVLVKVRAASVNPLDWHYMRGSPYIMRLASGLGAPEDTGMGVDFAGTVEAVGENVTLFKPGDEVFGGRGGAFADYLVIPASNVFKLPDASGTPRKQFTVALTGLVHLLARDGSTRTDGKRSVKRARAYLSDYVDEIERRTADPAQLPARTGSFSSNRVIQYTFILLLDRTPPRLLKDRPAARTRGPLTPGSTGK